MWRGTLLRVWAGLGKPWGQRNTWALQWVATDCTESRGKEEGAVQGATSSAP